MGARATSLLVPCIVEVPRFSLSAGVDPVPARRALFEAQYQRPAFDDLEDAFAWNRPDIAVVAIPHGKHLEVASFCLSRGVAVMKEKPYATTMAEAQHLRAMERASNLPVDTLLVRRYQYAYEALADSFMLIGDIRRATFEYCLGRSDPGSGWRADRALAGGGCIIDMGYHMVDLAVWYLGVPSAVVATSTCVDGTHACPDHPEARASLTLRYATGFEASIELSRVGATKYERIAVVGEQGNGRIEGGVLRLRIGNSPEREFGRLWGEEAALVRQMREFSKGLDDGTWMDRDQSHQMAIIDAAYKSIVSRTEQPVASSSMEGA